MGRSRVVSPCLMPSVKGTFASVLCGISGSTPILSGTPVGSRPNDWAPTANHVSKPWSAKADVPPAPTVRRVGFITTRSVSTGRMPRPETLLREESTIRARDLRSGRVPQNRKRSVFCGVHGLKPQATSRQLRRRRLFQSAHFAKSAPFAVPQHSIPPRQAARRCLG